MLEYLQELHFQIHDCVRESILHQMEDNATVVSQGHGDVSYKIDISAEEIIDNYFSSNPPSGGAVVICEGLGERVYPVGMNPEDAKHRIIIDPLDGTREIMYDKRSCWILTGVAPNLGENTRLTDIYLALQTEVPPSIQSNSTLLVAERGKGAWSAIWDVAGRRRLNEYRRLYPSQATDLRHGYAVFVNFFPGMKEIISHIEENILFAHLGPVEENSALTFTDQYISTAGQIYFLATGKYRFVADLRAYLGTIDALGKKTSLCCHPYDLATWLVISEAQGIITDIYGKELAYPLDTSTNCSWVGYANKMLLDSLEPLVRKEVVSIVSWKKGGIDSTKQ